MITCKDGVRVKRITPEMLRVFSLVIDVWKNRAPGVIPNLNSWNDSTHGKTSYHYIDYAVDFRSKTLTEPQKDLILNDLKVQLSGLNYDVLLESRGTDNEHFHIEFNARKAGKA